MKTWTACDHGDYGDNNGQCIAILGEDKRIALVLGPDTPETRKNAALVAAAPELLEALEVCLMMLERYSPRTCREARNAIAKVKGQP